VSRFYSVAIGRLDEIELPSLSRLGFDRSYTVLVRLSVADDKRDRVDPDFELSTFEPRVLTLPVAEQLERHLPLNYSPRHDLQTQSHGGSNEDKDAEHYNPATAAFDLAVLVGFVLLAAKLAFPLHLFRIWSVRSQFERAAWLRRGTLGLIFG
jgi:hypothetical protein